VPSGFVRRWTSLWGTNWKLHVFSRRQSLLFISQEDLFAKVRVHAADDQASASATLTLAEADVLLRGWLSDLPTPDMEHLGDLK
jgi:hypothetical protein